MKKNTKKIILIIITIIIIIFAIYFIWNNISIQKNNENYQNYTPQEEISDEQLRQTKVVLFFENIETGEIESEVKLIDSKMLIENPSKELILLLIKGPQSSKLEKLIPDGTILHDVKLEGTCAVINLSSEFLNCENKEKTINSIINTLTNLKEIESVKFLINGEENENFSEIYVKNK